MRIVYYFFLINLLMTIATLGQPSQAFAKNLSKSIEVEPRVSLNYYSTQSQKLLLEFNDQRKRNFLVELDTLFIKFERHSAFQGLSRFDLRFFDFNVLTQAVIYFLNDLRAENQMTLAGGRAAALRRKFQLEFTGLSYAIRKSNQINLQIQSEQFNKLHDILVSQSTGLFYASAREKNNSDIYCAAFYLYQLNFPIDLTALHLKNIGKKNGPYTSQLAFRALEKGAHIEGINSEQVEFLYDLARYPQQNDVDLRRLQKNYLKQLIALGDTERVKTVKREMANRLLLSTVKKFFTEPLEIPFHLFGFLQFLIGYIFVAWPLEFIIIFISLMVFALQSSSALTVEEKKRASKPWQKVWLMFTKAYLGAQVPFFSKLAASLILFGIGLYFNSARNFVESLIINL